MTRTPGRRETWPRLVVDEWTDTRDTLQLYLQVIGKVPRSSAPKHLGFDLSVRVA